MVSEEIVVSVSLLGHVFVDGEMWKILWLILILWSLGESLDRPVNFFFLVLACFTLRLFSCLVGWGSSSYPCSFSSSLFCYNT